MKLRRTLRSVGVGIAAAATAAFGAVAVSAPVSAASTDLSSLRIVEGQGVSDLVTLGQTRAQIAAVVNEYFPGGDTCANTPVGSKCTFELGTGSRVSVIFGNDQRVGEVIVAQVLVPRDQQWPTSVGNTNGLTVQQVQPLYPGSTITTNGVRAQLHTDGYRLETLARCYLSCQIFSTHYIIPGSGTTNPGGGGGGGGIEVSDPTFTGTIDVTTSRRGRAQLRITITDPEGGVTTGAVNRRLRRNRTISLNPDQFVSVDGPQGEYGYHVDVVKTNRRGQERVVATADGTFTLG